MQRSEQNNSNIIKELNNEINLVRSQLNESERIRGEMQDKIVLNTNFEKNV
jgi:hypothetical protein